jgi:hypothetical protein
VHDLTHLPSIVTAVNQTFDSTRNGSAMPIQRTAICTVQPSGSVPKGKGRDTPEPAERHNKIKLQRDGIGSGGNSFSHHTPHHERAAQQHAEEFEAKLEAKLRQKCVGGVVGTTIVPHTLLVFFVLFYR